jgi:glucuronoarabinoxylan endo-1,4-beta-xylanase
MTRDTSWSAGSARKREANISGTPFLSRLRMKGLLVGSVALLSLFALVFLVWSGPPQTAFINWTEEHQVIDGFGASCADFYKPLPEAMADFFFTQSGIGLSLLRVQVVSSTEDCKSFFGPDGGECLDVKSGATVLNGELAIAKQAVARGVIVWSTPWSPPATMKDNHSFAKGGSLLRSDYAAWAQSLAGYIRLMKEKGVPIYAMSVQNEPDLTTNYGSARYSGQQLHDFVPYLHSAIESIDGDSTKIMIAESSQWDFSLTQAAMTDPKVAGDVGILAAHGYMSKEITPAPDYTKHVWQTEDSSQSGTYDGSMADALAWASKIHQFLTLARVNAWHWWFLSDGPKYGNGTDNAALTDFNLNYPKRVYMTGQWSKFVRPEWIRIGVTYDGPLQITAFKDPAGRSFAIVAVNSGHSAVAQTFSLSGFSVNSVTPWITSLALSLAEQTPVSVSEGKFNYSLPPQSVTTFSGAVVNGR